MIAVREFLDLVSRFPDHFDETSMFNGGQHAKVGTNTHSNWDMYVTVTFSEERIVTDFFSTAICFWLPIFPFRL